SRSRSHDCFGDHDIAGIKIGANTSRDAETYHPAGAELYPTMKILEVCCTVLPVDDDHAGTVSHPRFEIHSRSSDNGFCVLVPSHCEPGLVKAKALPKCRNNAHIIGNIINRERFWAERLERDCELKIKIRGSGFYAQVASNACGKFCVSY